MVAVCGDPSDVLQNENFEAVGIEVNKENERDYFAVQKHSIDPTSLQNQGTLKAASIN